MTSYHLIFDEDLRQEIDQLSAEYKRNPNSPAGQEYTGVINALKALQSGREDAYEGKQLGYGPQSHDLRDCEVAGAADAGLFDGWRAATR